MQKCTILFLHSIEPLVTNWVVFDETGKIVPTTSIDDIKNTQTIVLVPAEDVLLTSVALPKLASQKLFQALPFALEEQLVDDVENLHFAIGPYQADDRWPVAVVQKEKMTAWLTALSSIGILPFALTPVTFALPKTENAWSVFSHENVSTVRTGEYSGFACDARNLEMLAQLNSAELVPVELVSQQLIEVAQVLTKTIPINLLQGHFRAKQTASQAKKIWQLAGILTAVWVGLIFVGPLISLLLLHQQVKKVDVAIQGIYKQHFPQASTVVAPRQRMEEKLKTAFAGSNKSNFLVLLSVLSKSMSGIQHIQLRNLEFRDRQLTIEVSTNTFDNLDTLVRVLTQQGLSVKRQNASTADTEIKANLVMTAGGV